MAWTPLDPTSPEATSRHLLLLAEDVTPDEVETLAVSRFPRAAWEVAPGETAQRTGGMFGGRSTPAPGVLRLSRHSSLHGPFTVGDDALSALKLPPAARTAYVVHAPVERGAEPWAVGGDRDGLRRAFPDGLPVRDEERTVAWLVSAARRLGGAVRTVTREARPGVLLVPDPAAAVDLTIWSDIWLEPEAGLAVTQQAVPRAYLNLPARGWEGPPRATGERPAPGAEGLDPERRRALHAAADEHDIATLTAPPPMHGYGVLADLELDGMLALEVSGETRLPPVIAALGWAHQGAVVYRVRWEPADLHEREAERPSLQHRVERGRATPLVVAVARAVHAAVGGEITDAMDFLVDPRDL